MHEVSTLIRLNFILILLHFLVLFRVVLGRLWSLLFLRITLVLLLNDLAYHVLQLQHVLSHLVSFFFSSCLHLFFKLLHLHHVQFNQLFRLLVKQLVHQGLLHLRFLLLVNASHRFFLGSLTQLNLFTFGLLNLLRFRLFFVLVL